MTPQEKLLAGLPLKAHEALFMGLTLQQAEQLHRMYRDHTAIKKSLALEPGRVHVRLATVVDGGLVTITSQLQAEDLVKAVPEIAEAFIKEVFNGHR